MRSQGHREQALLMCRRLLFLDFHRVHRRSAGHEGRSLSRTGPDGLSSAATGAWNCALFHAQHLSVKG